jgi:hypothetical protein
MAKILRALQKVFGDNVVATDNIAQFGSLKAGAPQFSKDPSVIQGLNAYLEGWKSAVVNNNAPALQDENALHYLWSRQLAYLFQAGIPEYDTATEYHLGSFVQDAGVVYRSIQNTNENNALTDGAWWVQFPAATVGSQTSLTASGTISLTASAALEEQILIGTATAGGVTLAATAFGTTTPTNGKKIILIGDSDANPITLPAGSAAKNLWLNGDCTLARGKILVVVYNSTLDAYLELTRNS